MVGLISVLLGRLHRPPEIPVHDGATRRVTRYLSFEGRPGVQYNTRRR